MAVPVRRTARKRPSVDDGASTVVSRYREFAPSISPEPAVVCSWEGTSGWSRSLRVLPDGCADVVWNGTAMLIAPATSRLTRYSTAGGSVGVRLRPGWIGQFLSVPAHEVSRPTLLDDLWGSRRCERVTEALHRASGQGDCREALEQLIADTFAAVGPSDRRAMAAIEHLSKPGATVETASRLAGLSERQLRRLVSGSAGIGPSDLKRVARFRRFLGLLDHLSRPTEGSLAGLALDAGYADQAHLSRDCRQLTGSTPSTLVADRYKTD